MFHRNVRAAVFDSAVTPSAWMGGPDDDPALGTFLRIGSDFGEYQALRAFMDQRGGAGAGRAFSAGSPEKTRAKWSSLLAHAELRAGP